MHLAAAITRRHNSNVLTTNDMADDGKLNMEPDDQYVVTKCESQWILKLKVYTKNEQVYSPVKELRSDNEKHGLHGTMST